MLLSALDIGYIGRSNLRLVRRFLGVLRHHAHQRGERVAGFQIRSFLFRQRLFRGTHSNLHMAEPGRSGHRDCPFIHQPGHRDLRHAHVMETSRLRYALDDAGVLRRGSVILALGVFILFKALGGFPRQFGQPSAGQHAVRRNGAIPSSR